VRRLLVACSLSFGCSTPQHAPRAGQSFDWLATHSPPVLSGNADAVIAGAAAVRAVIAEEEGGAMFKGCRSPADGLAVTVFSPSQPVGYFIVSVEQNFKRCGDVGEERALDWNKAFAVTGEGVIIGRAPWR